MYSAIASSLKITSGPSAEPITLARAKEQCRIDHDEEDVTISGLISAVRRKLEEDTERCVCLSTSAETCVLKLDEFPCRNRGLIELYRSPILAVSSLTYYDGNNTLQTLSTSAYDVDVNSSPGRIYPAYGYVWPETYCRPEAVTVTFTGGYTTAVDPLAIQAMLLLLGHWWDRRETAVEENLRSIPFGYQVLADQLRWRVGL